MFKRAAIIIVLGFAFAASSQAQLIVGKNSGARDCYLRAKSDLSGRQASIQACRDALATKALNQKDQSATYVNLGILLMRGGDYEKSLNAYDKAISLRPKLAEAHINRGACLIYLDRPAEAIKALTISIDLGTDHLSDALYNRAMAYEKLDQSKEAYLDYKQALEIRPDWELPARSLQRFQVVTKPKG